MAMLTWGIVAVLGSVFVTALLVRGSAFSMRITLSVQMVVFIVPAFLDDPINIYRLLPAALVAYWVVLFISRRRARLAGDLDIVVVYGGLPLLVVVIALLENWPDRFYPSVVERSPPVETPLPTQDQVAEIKALMPSDVELMAGPASVESELCAVGDLLEVRDPPPVKPGSVEATDKSARRVLDRLIVQIEHGASMAAIEETFCQAGVEAIGVTEDQVYYVAIPGEPSAARQTKARSLISIAPDIVSVTYPSFHPGLAPIYPKPPTLPLAEFSPPTKGTTLQWLSGRKESILGRDRLLVKLKSGNKSSSVYGMFIPQSANNPFIDSQHELDELWPLAVGKKIELREHGVEQMAQAWLSIKVIGDERVTVPAGVFDTYVIKASGRTGSPHHRSYGATVWYAPALGWFVKRAVDTAPDVVGPRKRFDYLVHIELPQHADS